MRWVFISSSRHVPRVHSAVHQNFKEIYNTSRPTTTTLPLFLGSLDTSALRLVALLRLMPLSLWQRPSLVQVLVTLLHLMVQQAVLSLQFRNGVATFRLVPFLSNFAGLRVFVIFSILVRPPPAGRSVKRLKDAASKFSLDGQSLYNQRSNPVRLNAEGRPDIQYFLTCGSDAVEVVVSHLSFEQAGEDAETTPIAPLQRVRDARCYLTLTLKVLTTNSEGETVIPSNTATLPGTNSEGLLPIPMERLLFLPPLPPFPVLTLRDLLPILRERLLCLPALTLLAFTKNSNGETIFPTGTATGTQDQSSAPTATSPRLP
ncbi:hypothetical protein FocnCong_v021463 [Fusarium oxysporum f. sp. conglutinans]|nr:hypothetical protein FocnCong_v021463 [Fusarium oxysporum f. sp. conglutinans]